MKMRPVKAFKIYDLASSLSWYLNYKSSVRRNYILDEKTIKIPISEYLESSDVQNIDLETLHPDFDLKRIDLTFEDLNLKKSCAIEFKYIIKTSPGTTTERKRIFKDLLRLHYYIQKTSHKGYFLICGNKLNFNASFVTQQRVSYIDEKKNQKISDPAPSGFFTEWFRFSTTDNNSEKEIDLTKQNSDYKDIYDSVLSKYKKAFKGKDFRPPKRIKTRCVYISTEQVDSRLKQTSKVGIWEII